MPFLLGQVRRILHPEVKMTELSHIHVSQIFSDASALSEVSFINKEHLHHEKESSHNV